LEVERLCEDMDYDNHLQNCEQLGSGSGNGRHEELGGRGLLSWMPLAPEVRPSMGQQE
jgi:hypothetical protein